MARFRRRDSASSGQALVEFALTLLLFLGLLLGVLDFGRAIFMSNGVSQAAREIARVTSVHPGNPLGSSADTAEVVDTQQNLIFELQDPDFSCVDIEGNSVPLSAGQCLPGNWVRVEMTALYRPVTPIFNFIALDLRSSSSVEIP